MFDALKYGRGRRTRCHGMLHRNIPLTQLCTCIFPGHSVPSVLQSTFQAQACEELFKHLCISGTPKIRLHAGLLLVQLCGGERWWGQFLSNVLQELYNSEQLLIFPQDRYDSFWLPQVQFNYCQVLIMKVTQKCIRDVNRMDRLVESEICLIKIISYIKKSIWQFCHDIKEKLTYKKNTKCIRLVNFISQLSVSTGSILIYMQQNDKQQHTWLLIQKWLCRLVYTY